MPAPPDPLFDSSLELVGVGHDGIIYGITPDIVLKSPRTFEITGLSKDAQEYLCQDQARSIKMLTMERAGLQKIGPHTNIVSAISLEYPEGIYFIRYATDIDLFLRENGKPSLQTRLGWYVATMRALLHLHDRNMVHADVHESNLLCDEQGLQIVLCDFPTATTWGEAISQNVRVAGGRVLEPFDICDDRLDRFLAAKFMLRCECGNETGGWLRYTEEYEVYLLHPVRTGNVELDLVITNGLMAKYSNTRAMLKALEAIAIKEGTPISKPYKQFFELEAKIARLKVEVEVWRMQRLQLYGYVVKEALPQYLI